MHKTKRTKVNKIKNLIKKIRKSNVKFVDPINSDTKYFYSKRHYKDSFLPSVENINNGGLKTFYPESYSTTKKEFPIEKLLGGKQRIQSLCKQRNGYRSKTPGEKPYGNPEYSIDYFKEGELIPGSSNVMNYKKTTSRKSFYFYETLDLTKKTLNPDKLWVNKEKNEKLESDKNYVKFLNIWEENIGKEISAPKKEEEKKIISKDMRSSVSGKTTNSGAKKK